MWLEIATKGAYVAPHTPLFPCCEHRISDAGTQLLFLLPPDWHLC